MLIALLYLTEMLSLVYIVCNIVT